MGSNLRDYKDLVQKLLDKLEALGDEAPPKGLWENFTVFLENIDLFSSEEEELERKISNLEKYLEELDDKLDALLLEAQNYYDEEINDHKKWLSLYT